MAEFERPDYLHRGHLFNPAPIRRDLWLLLLIFLADQRYAELTEDEFYEDGYAQPLLGLNSEFSEDETTRILLSSAIALRAIDDRDGGVLGRLRPCGELQPDVTVESVETLNMREACNKIVHTEMMHFDIERLDGGPIADRTMAPNFVQPTLYLYGTHRQARWRVVLDVIAYVREAVRVL